MGGVNGYYFRGLAQATLAILNEEQRTTHLIQMLDSYQRAFDICHEPGDIQFQRLLLDELKPLDRDGLLKPVFNLLAQGEQDDLLRACLIIRFCAHSGSIRGVPCDYLALQERKLGKSLFNNYGL